MASCFTGEAQAELHAPMLGAVARQPGGLEVFSRAFLARYIGGPHCHVPASSASREGPRKKARQSLAQLFPRALGGGAGEVASQREQAGVHVLVILSVAAAWEAEGGQEKGRRKQEEEAGVCEVPQRDSSRRTRRSSEEDVGCSLEQLTAELCALHPRVLFEVIAWRPHTPLLDGDLLLDSYKALAWETHNGGREGLEEGGMPISVLHARLAAALCLDGGRALQELRAWDSRGCVLALLQLWHACCAKAQQTAAPSPLKASGRSASRERQTHTQAQLLALMRQACRDHVAEARRAERKSARAGHCRLQDLRRIVSARPEVQGAAATVAAQDAETGDAVAALLRDMQA